MQDKFSVFKQKSCIQKMGFLSKLSQSAKVPHHHWEVGNHILMIRIRLRQQIDNELMTVNASQYCHRYGLPCQQRTDKTTRPAL